MRRRSPRSCGGATTTTPTIERVQQIIRKEHLRTDPVVQVHEDALCLVFLQTQLADVANRLGPEKVRTFSARPW